MPTYLDVVEVVVLFCSVTQISVLQADLLPGYKKDVDLETSKSNIWKI